MPTKRVLRVSSPKPSGQRCHSPSDARAPPSIRDRGRKECAAPPTIAKRAKETNAPSENGGLRRAMGRRQGGATRPAQPDILPDQWRLPQNDGDDHSVGNLWRTRQRPRQQRSSKRSHWPPGQPSRSASPSPRFALPAGDARPMMWCSDLTSGEPKAPPRILSSLLMSETFT